MLAVKKDDWDKLEEIVEKLQADVAEEESINRRKTSMIRSLEAHNNSLTQKNTDLKAEVKHLQDSLGECVPHYQAEMTKICASDENFARRPTYYQNYFILRRK